MRGGGAGGSVGVQLLNLALSISLFKTICTFRAEEQWECMLTSVQIQVSKNKAVCVDKTSSDLKRYLSVTECIMDQHRNQNDWARN